MHAWVRHTLKHKYFVRLKSSPKILLTGISPRLPTPSPNKQTTTKSLLSGPPFAFVPLRSSQAPQAKSPKTPGEIALACVPLLRWHPSDRQRPPPRASAMVTPRRVPRDPRSNAISNVSPGKNSTVKRPMVTGKGTGWTTFIKKKHMT